MLLPPEMAHKTLFDNDVSKMQPSLYEKGDEPDKASVNNKSEQRFH
jgi:hypothetical protein